LLIVNVQALAAHHTAFAPATRHDGRVTGLPAGSGQDALGHKHPAYIFWTGFAPHEDDLLSLAGPFLSLVSGKDGLAHSGAGNGVDAACELAPGQLGPRHRLVN